MPRLFGRALELNLAGVSVAGFSASFEVTKSLDKTQNTAEVSVRNLAPDTRARLHAVGQEAVIEIRAGYEDEPELAMIFRGRTRIITSTHTGSEWVTKLETGDGDAARTAPVSKSYPAGASTQNVIKDMVRLMKAEAGNLVQALKGAPDKPLDGSLVVHEQSDNTLARMLNSLDLEHSWQDDGLQILTKGGYLNASAVLLNGETGLVDAPAFFGKRTISGKTQQPTVHFTSLLNANITPGRMCLLDSPSFSGKCVVYKVRHAGDTAGDEWYSAAEARVI